MKQQEKLDNYTVKSTNTAGFENKNQGGAHGTRSNFIEIPSISLPKGGGALKGIDEKFEVNSANGTASFSVPLPITPGRNDFSPSLSLSYNSGAGNSPFGLGWNIDYPAIQRKTDKKLPQYKDDEASDVFLFSSFEDLVPYPVQNEVNRTWHSPAGDYNIQRYRPRVEGLFARIEKITPPGNRAYWRVTTRDNITTFFGRSDSTRLTDPVTPTHIFKWLPEISYDNKGNWIIYEYKEDSNKAEVHRSLIPNETCEQNRRNGTALFTNQYLKRVKYGNVHSYLPHTLDQANPYDPPLPQDNSHFFELVFDYGEHDINHPVSDESVDMFWEFRTDAFSDYRAGFEIRTNRLCQRVLMFHHFEDIPSFGRNYLVRSLDLRYEPSSINNSGNTEITYLKSITQTSYIKNADNPSYIRRSLPPMEFTYERLSWNNEVKEVDTENIIHAPVGLTNNYQWVDLYGEGISGILSEQAEGWYYKSNLGDVDEDGKVSFSRAQVVAPKPSFTGLQSGVFSLQDLDANGEKQVVVNSPGLQGYFQLGSENNWEPFEPFAEVANLDLRDPNTRLIDLNGDGKPELVITEETAFVWYASTGKQGYAAAEFAVKDFNEEKGPAIVFADGDQSIFLADMSGDGLTDIVRIRNSEICYWPNLGYGRFGAKVAMSNPPVFDLPDHFDPAYLHLADVSGTGATDILYLGENRFKAYLNLSGNAWSDAHQIDPFLPIDSNTKVSVVDLLGTGTSCIVWSSDLPHHSYAPMRYIDLMDSRKPHVMVQYTNNIGKETHFEYKSSTWFYLKDKLEETPWVTKLPFPVQVVSKVTITDKWRQARFATFYSYHHGYYDHQDREFRGFGRVEHVDVEDYGIWAEGNANSPYITDDQTLYQPPIKTVTWFHTGAFISREKILNQFSKEYFIPFSEGFQEKILHEPDLTGQNLSAAEWTEALRACKGMMLRQEVYELDVHAWHENKKQVHVKLFNTAYHNCRIQVLQPKEENTHAVFLITESEAITYQYELALTVPLLHPDPRISHILNLSTDEFGNVLDTIVVAYPRFQTFSDSSLPADTNALINRVQEEAHLAYTHNQFTSDATDDPWHYRLRLPCEVSTYELTGINSPREGFYYTLEQLRNTDNPDGASHVPYHELPDSGEYKKRIVEQLRLLYFGNNLTNSLPFGELNALALPYETYKLALTEELLSAVFEDKLTGEVRTKLNDHQTSGYLFGAELRHYFPEEATEGQYWIRSGTAGFNEGPEDAARHFFLPERYTDPFNNITLLQFDNRNLFIQSSTDPVNNRVSVNSFDYRVMAPLEIVDINGNITEVVYDALGLPAAVAVKGKGNEGDNLEGIETNLDPDTVFRFFTHPYSEESARRFLGNATARHLYYLGEAAHDTSTYGIHPACAVAIIREKHVAQLDSIDISPIQASFEYSDGTGQVIVKKMQAEPEEGSGTLRWVTNGRTIFNNKGKPVKKYEPYFSESGHVFEEPGQVGVTPIFYYDALGRQIRTELPDGTYTRVAFSPWHQATFDANDTVEEGNAWYDRNIAEPITSPRYRAALLASVHRNTPGLGFLDSLGREVVSVAHNRFEDSSDTIIEEKHVTFLKMDAEGRPLWIKDARGNLVMQYVRREEPDPPQSIDTIEPGTYIPAYDIAGNLLFQHSMDGGNRWTLMDAAAQPLCTWDNREAIQLFNYDALRRPITVLLKNNDHPEPVTVMLMQYGDKDEGDGGMSYEESQRHNLRGQVNKAYDQSGVVINKHLDFKGNKLEVQKRIALSFDRDTDWTAADILQYHEEADNQLMPETFTQITEYDALNRMIRLYNWHRAPENKVAVYEPVYNERGLLQGEDIVINATKTGDRFIGGTRIHALRRAEYNAKAQKTKLEYGTEEDLELLTTTVYEYDEETFRLKTLTTTRHGEQGNPLQHLIYQYDPLGNITEINNLADDTIFFGNRRVEPKNYYEYDALYRLIYAEGREHLGQNATPTAPDTYNSFHTRQSHRGDGNVMGTYKERYAYDSVGNILHVNHHNSVSEDLAWNRSYQYATDSNRLLITEVTSPGISGIEERYTYNEHGSITSMNHLPMMDWDFTEHLKHIVIAAHPGSPPSLEAWYCYDAQKQRSRKRVVKQGSVSEERIYLGGLEWYRRWNGEELVEEIETVHLFEGDQRVLMVDNVLQTDHSDLGTGLLYRYQYSNHLGSAAIELNQDGEVITHEEYFPYGGTSYQGINASIRAVAKRYRYTGMERDEESGLSYHTARYYMPWLGRWGSVDPIGIQEGINVFKYSGNNPVIISDYSGLQGIRLGYQWEGRNHDPENWQLSNAATAESQLHNIQEGLRAIGRIQAEELGIENADFVNAEASSLYIEQVGNEYYLRVDLERATSHRGEYGTTWILERLEELSRSSAIIDVGFGNTRELGFTLPQGYQRQYSDSHGEGPYRHIQSPSDRVYVGVRTESRTGGQRTALDIGFTLIHELVGHAWRDATFIDVSQPAITSHHRAGGHVGGAAIIRPGDTDIRSRHALVDLESELLSYYFYRASEIDVSDVTSRSTDEGGIPTMLVTVRELGGALAPVLERFQTSDLVRTAREFGEQQRTRTRSLIGILRHLHGTSAIRMHWQR